MEACAAGLHSLRKSLPPLRTRLAVFAGWGLLVGLVFFSIYPATNSLTGNAGQQYALFFPLELHIPFVPAFIWPYLSMYLLFLLPPFLLDPVQIRRLAQQLIVATGTAGVLFFLLPARLGFSRVLPSDEFYRGIYQGLFYLDQPFNLVPSLHVVYSTAIFLALVCRAGKALRTLFSMWLVLIVISTLLVHQHHLLDVISGMALAVFMYLLWEKKND